MKIKGLLKPPIRLFTRLLAEQLTLARKPAPSEVPPPASHWRPSPRPLLKNSPNWPECALGNIVLAHSPSFDWLISTGYGLILAWSLQLGFILPVQPVHAKGNRRLTWPNPGVSSLSQSAVKFLCPGHFVHAVGNTLLINPRCWQYFVDQPEPWLVPAWSLIS